MKVEDTIKFFEDKFEESTNELKSITSKSDDEEIEERCSVSVHYATALFALKIMYGAENEKNIKWKDIKNYLFIPICIKRRKCGEYHWKENWDIVIEIKKDKIITCISKDLLKKEKGLTWEIYFKKIQ